MEVNVNVMMFLGQTIAFGLIALGLVLDDAKIALHL
jgi:hypothetical protein